MSISIAELIAWFIAGIITIWICRGNDSEVPLSSYIICWAMLLLEIFVKILRIAGGQ